MRDQAGKFRLTPLMAERLARSLLPGEELGDALHTDNSCSFSRTYPLPGTVPSSSHVPVHLIHKTAAYIWSHFNLNYVDEKIKGK